MENIFINKTETTPEIKIKFNNNSIYITGICIPEDPYHFFKPLSNAIEELKKNKNQLVIYVYLEYFNTSSSKFFINLLLKLKEQGFNTLLVNWITEEGDEESLEAGELMQEMTGITFRYQQVKED